MSFLALALFNSLLLPEAHKSDSSSSNTSGSTGGRVQAQLPPVGHESADVVDVVDAVDKVDAVDVYDSVKDSLSLSSSP
jgi:hypothetical protein